MGSSFRWPVSYITHAHTHRKKRREREHTLMPKNNSQVVCFTPLTRPLPLHTHTQPSQCRPHRLNKKLVHLALCALCLHDYKHVLWQHLISENKNRLHYNFATFLDLVLKQTCFLLSHLGSLFCHSWFDGLGSVILPSLPADHSASQCFIPTGILINKYRLTHHKRVSPLSVSNVSTAGMKAHGGIAQRKAQQTAYFFHCD